MRRFYGKSRTSITVGHGWLTFGDEPVSSIQQLVQQMLQERVHLPRCRDYQLASVRSRYCDETVVGKPEGMIVAYWDVLTCESPCEFKYGLAVGGDAVYIEVAEAAWSVAEWAVAPRFDNPRATVLVLVLG